jgi:tetratricopeptide (TPR) repeat protein
MELHSRNEIDSALTAASRALEADPTFADALQYIGSTLVQKQHRYAEGLRALERAKELAADDPVIYYTLGWCYEFIAYRLRRRPVQGLDAAELIEKAEHYLRRCLELNPSGKLRDDAADLLSSIIKEDVP